MRQVCPNRVIPIYSHQAQRGAGNETSADSEEPTQNSNDKADDDQINRIDIRVGDREKHQLSPTAPQEAKQEGRYRVQCDRLTGDKQKRDRRINVAMLRFKIEQPAAQKMKNQEEVDNDENRINRQFDRKRSQALSGVPSHEGKMDEALTG